MGKRRIPAPTPYDELNRLFREAAQASLLESSGQMVICRCSHPVEGVDDQPTCDLPVAPHEQMGQMAAGKKEGGYLCRVHANPGHFRRAGIDPQKIFDGSPHNADTLGKAAPIRLAKV